MLPRPDIASLGISYRRIPIVSIGRDVYLDSRLQFAKLDALSSSNSIAPSTPEHHLILALSSEYVTDAGIFARLAELLISSDLPVVTDPNYQTDREDLIGFKIDRDDLPAIHARAMQRLEGMCRLLETTILSDGRDFVFGGKEPSHGDIELVWPMLFVSSIPGILPEERFSAKTFPKVWAWIDRFKAAYDAAKEKNASKVTNVKGPDAVKAVATDKYHDADGDFDETDFDVKAFGLKKGDTVSLGPTDYGAAHRDKGKLLSINSEEVVIEVATKDGSSVRVHAPRHGFQIRKE